MERAPAEGQVKSLDMGPWCLTVEGANASLWFYGLWDRVEVRGKAGVEKSWALSQSGERGFQGFPLCHPSGGHGRGAQDLR